MLTKINAYAFEPMQQTNSISNPETPFNATRPYTLDALECGLLGPLTNESLVLTLSMS